jgi:hypothetical protein
VRLKIKTNKNSTNNILFNYIPDKALMFPPKEEKSESKLN